MSMRIPSIREIIKSYLETDRKSLHVAMPGHIIGTWDHEKQSADIQIDIKDVKTLEDLSASETDYPIIKNVPLMFPRTSEYQITLPIAEGDRVLVVFCDTDLNQWCVNNEPHTSTGRITSPGFLDNHTINGAVAIPGFYPTHIPAGPLGPLSIPGPGGDSSTILLGKRDSMAGSADFVALAGKVMIEFNRIESEFAAFRDAYNGHTHATAPTGPVSTPSTQWVAGPASPAEVKNADVKVT